MRPSKSSASSGERLRGRKVQNINSTAVGGGVAEILNRLIPLLLEVGVDARWDVIRGGDEFFAVTKTIHNALHGQAVTLTEHDIAVFRETTEQNLASLALSDDIVFIHDPQPAGLIEKRAPGLALDMAVPHRHVRPVSAGVGVPPPVGRAIRCRGLLRTAVLPDPAIDQVLIAPSIDRSPTRTGKLDARTIESVVTGLGIDPSRPLVTQVSRFDRLKDPLGVIDAYLLARKYNDCPSSSSSVARPPTTPRAPRCSPSAASGPPATRTSTWSSSRPPRTSRSTRSSARRASSCRSRCARGSG